MCYKFATKVFAYFVVIVAGHLVYSFLAVIELMSIIENLIEMGMDVLKHLAVWACRKRDEITGGNK